MSKNNIKQAEVIIPEEVSSETPNKQGATLADIWINPNDARRSLPFAAGQSFNFVYDEDPAKMWVPKSFADNNGQVHTYMALVAQDGTEISATQLLRRRNGLPINGNTTLGAAEDFVNLFPESGVLTLTIARVITRQFEDNQGNKTTSNYIEWHPVPRQD